MCSLFALAREQPAGLLLISPCQVFSTSTLLLLDFLVLRSFLSAVFVHRPSCGPVLKLAFGVWGDVLRFGGCSQASWGLSHLVIALAAEKFWVSNEDLGSVCS